MEIWQPMVEILLRDGIAKEEPWDKYDSTKGVLDTPCPPAGRGDNSESEPEESLGWRAAFVWTPLKFPHSRFVWGIQNLRLTP